MARNADRRLSCSFWNFRYVAVISANLASASGFEQLLHCREAQRIVLVVLVGDGRGAVGADAAGKGGLLLFLGIGRRGDNVGLTVFLVGDGRQLGPGGRGLAALGFRRRLDQHRVEVEDLTELHPAFVQGVGPVDHRGEGHRRFAQAGDHRVAPGLDPLGDGDLAFAAEQFDRAHLAQVHADRIVGPVERRRLDHGGRGDGGIGVDRLFLVVVIGRGGARGLGALFGPARRSR